MTDLNLTDIVNQDTIDGILRPDFSINSRSNYDRKDFVKHAGDLFDLKEYSKQLRENTNNFDALYDLIGVLQGYVPGDLGTNIQTWESNPHEALKQANTLESQGSKGIGKFVERNKEKLLDKLDAKQLYTIFANTPIYEGGNIQFKKTKQLRDKISLMQKAAQEGKNPGDAVQDYVNQLIQIASDDKKEFIMRNREAMMTSLTNAVIMNVQKEYSNLFKDSNGNLNKGQIKGFLKDNYNMAQDFIDGVPNAEKDKYWNDNLKPHYLQIAKTLYSAEKKAQKFADNRPKEQRKERARALGMAA